MSLARVFRLFVSSTFTDLAEERRALQENVFPRLQAFCRERGAEFQPVDLRWGVSAVAARDQKTVGICIDEVARCREATARPNFLLLLSERYGWCPPPPEVPQEEFRAIVDGVKTDPDLRADVELFSRWYPCDDNAVPPVHRLRRRTGDYVSRERWEPDEMALVRGFRTAARKLVAQGALPASALLRYDGSATEQEIAAGIPESPCPGSVLCVFRNVKGPPLPSLVPRFVDADGESRDRVERLKARLRRQVPQADMLEYPAEWVPTGVTTQHIPGLCDEVYERLSRTIVEELGRAGRDDLDEERAEHAAFADERLRRFTGRQKPRAQLASLIASSAKSPFAVVAPPGFGKSAFMAKVAAEISQRYQDTVVVRRFVGATPDSSAPRALLRGLCREIARAYGTAETASETYAELTREFRKSLGHAWHGRPLLVFIDALDQLVGVDATATLPWLPAELPPYARVVVSALPRLRPALDRVVPADCMVELKPFSASEGMEMLDDLLANDHRTLNPSQRAVVGRRVAETPVPLFIRLVFEQVRHWTSEHTELDIGGDVGEVIRALLARLSAEENHGPVLVAAALSLLVVARHGLAEHELLEVLGTDAEVLADHRRRSPDSPPVQGLPHIIWSRLRHELAPYLSERSVDSTALLGFFHGQVVEQVRAAYLAGDAAKGRHQELAQNFARRPLHLDAAGQFPDLRKLSELAFQQTEAESWDDLAVTLLDYRFIDAKLRATGPQSLLDDFDHAHAARRGREMARSEWDVEMDRVADALRLSAHVLRGTPEQLPAHLVGRLSASPTTRIARLLASCRDLPRSVWLRPVVASLRDPGDALLRTLGGHGAIVYRVSVSRSGRYAVSAGNDRVAMVWDLAASCELQRLVHDESVFDAGVTADDRHVVCAAGSRLVMWDLATGARLQSRDPGGGWIRALAMTGDGRAIFGSDEGVVGEWALGTDQLLRYEGSGGPVRGMALLGDETLATCSEVRSWGLPSWVVVWDLKLRRKLREWPDVGGGRGMASAMSGQMLLTSGQDGSVKVWDPQSETLVRTLRHHSWGCEGVAATTDGRFAVSGAVDQTIKVWDLQSGNELATLRGHHNMIRALAMLPGERFLSGSDDQTIRLWDLRRCQVPQRAPAHTGRIGAMALAPDGQRLATGCNDGAVSLWLIDTGGAVWSIGGHSLMGSEIYSLSFTPDGARIVTVSNGAIVHIRSAATGDVTGELHLVPRSSPGGRSLVLSPDAKHFFYGSELFELDTGKVADVLPDYETSGLAFLSDGRRVLCEGRQAYLWDMVEHRQVGILPPFRAAAIAMLPGDRVVSVGYDAAVRVWDLNRLALVKELHGHRGRIDGVAATAMATRSIAVSASGDHDAKLWDLDAGTLLAAFSAEAPLFSCALSPDGRHAAVGDENGNLHFLSVEGLSSGLLNQGVCQRA